MPHHQIHFRISDGHHRFLLLLAAETGESMATVVRRIIQSAMVQMKKSSTTLEPVSLIDSRKRSTNGR